MGAPDVNTVSAKDALARLEAGNRRNRTDRPEAAGRDGSRRRELLGGQSPFAVILSCSDSRIVPEIIFDTGIGDLFVVRVAGNVADSAALASIEYAVAHLGTKLVVVLAHESCGAVTAALSGEFPSDHTGHLMSMIRPAIEASEVRDVDTAARRNARLAAKLLLDKSDIISEAVRSTGVRIVSAFYRLEAGDVEFDDGAV
jgi:carbonic anhydrase